MQCLRGFGLDPHRFPYAYPLLPPPSLAHPAPPPLLAGWSEPDREAKRAALRRVLDAAVAGNARGVHYYQGLHDVAAVLLFVCGGERPAYRLLRALVGGHLRDCTRPDLAAATETLRLLYPILDEVRSGRCWGWVASPVTCTGVVPPPCSSQSATHPYTAFPCTVRP